MNSDRKHGRSLVYIGLSLGLTIGVFAYLLSQVSWRQVADLILHLDRRLLGLFFCLSLSMHLLRTWRYRVVLASVGEAPGFLRLFFVVLVRSLCVDLLPARTGEVVYVYLLRTRLGVELGAATASFALAFLFDLMALAPLLVVALALVGSGLALAPLGLVTASAALLVATAGAVHFLPGLLKCGFAIASRLLRRTARFRRWVRRFLAATRGQIRRARNRGTDLPVFGLSLGVRLSKYLALYVLLLAMLRPQGYDLHSLPFPKVFLGFCAAEMAASLPVSGIAGFGAYQGAWALTFILLGFSADMAKATSISHHVFTQAYGYLLGLVAALALLALPLARPRRRPPAPNA